jgi:serine/threonine protein kinase
MPLEDTVAEGTPPIEKECPEVVAGFEILSLIGEGGMGKVYKARQKSLDRFVALKVLPEKLAANVEFVKRFEYEARAAARLNHPNIVQVIEQGNDGAVRFIAFEFIDGPTLEAVLREKGRLPEREALEIVHDIACALDCATAEGLVHRDVKPDNILLTGAGVPKLADLGLARLEEEPIHLTKTGIVMGTPFYMSPEQALGEGTLDGRSDLFSLGVVLYRCVTGTLPFISDSAMAILTHNITEDLPDPRSANPALSDDMVTLIRGLTARARNDRYPTPRFAVAEIEGILAGRAATGPRPYLDAMKTQPMASPARSSSARRRSIRDSSLEAALAPAVPPPASEAPPAAALPAKAPPAPAPPATRGRLWFALSLLLFLTLLALIPLERGLVSPPWPPPVPPAVVPAVVPPPVPPALPPDPSPVPTAAHPEVAPVATALEIAFVHSAEVAAPVSLSTAELPLDARVWDGHGWRRTEPGHVHAKGCGHFFRGGRWNLYGSDPRPYPYELTEEQREQPESGIYDAPDGKTYYLPNHAHGQGCGHVLEKGHWRLQGE